MTILRSIVTTTTAIAATALPAAYVASSLSSSSSSSSSSPSSPFSKSLDFRFLSPQSTSSSGSGARFGLIKSFSSPPSAVQMENPKSSSHEDLKSDLLTEFMVDMKCEGCVSAVKNKIETLEGVKSVEVDLSYQVVRILGSSPVITMENALEQTGRKARLIGQGVPEDFLVSAAVAEFKGPDIFGVVRFAQTHMELARIEANISGLPPGKHGWSINEFGDLTRGPASTGKMYNPPIQGSESEGWQIYWGGLKGGTFFKAGSNATSCHCKAYRELVAFLNDSDATQEPLGDLGTLDVDEKGEAYYSGLKKMLRVVDLIGRSIVLYASEDKSDAGLAAAVIARSAGVGENYKKLCTCDGTTIWEAKPDIVTSKV